MRGLCVLIATLGMVPEAWADDVEVAREHYRLGSIYFERGQHEKALSDENLSGPLLAHYTGVFREDMNCRSIAVSGP
jgi:hypothetical protein